MHSVQRLGRKQMVYMATAPRRLVNGPCELSAMKIYPLPQSSKIKDCLNRLAADDASSCSFPGLDIDHQAAAHSAAI